MPAAADHFVFLFHLNSMTPSRLATITSALKGGYLFDTANPGNSNHGHEFKDGPKGNGVNWAGAFS